MSETKESRARSAATINAIEQDIVQHEDYPPDWLLQRYEALVKALNEAIAIAPLSVIPRLSREIRLASERIDELRKAKEPHAKTPLDAISESRRQRGATVATADRWRNPRVAR